MDAKKFVDVESFHVSHLERVEREARYEDDDRRDFKMSELEYELRNER